MSKVKFISTLFLLSLFLGSCQIKQEEEHLVKIETTYGEIVIKLHNQTPKHRDNFIKLADSGFFNNLKFHRVIKDFVVQGGDPLTRGEIADSLIGEADSGYLIDAEFIDSLIHKRGAVGMAREGDDINPQKKSSGSQFYIVVGKKFSDADFIELEKKILKRKTERLTNEFKSLLISESTLKAEKLDTVKINITVKQKVDSVLSVEPVLQLSAKQKSIYKSIGGIPHLDGNYTVFGEVIQGMDIVEKISLLPTNERDIPKQDVRFSIKTIK